MRFFLSLLSIEVIGAFFALLVFRKGRRGYSIIEAATLSFLLGLGAVTLQLFFYDLLGIGFSLMDIAAVPVVLAIMVFARYAAKPERFNEFFAGSKGLSGWSVTERLIVVGIIVQIVWVVLLVLPVPVNAHDAVANYALKAKMFHFAGAIPSGFFGWPETTVAHPDYPLFLPFVMTWVYAFTGFNDFQVNMIMPCIYVAFLGLLYGQLRKLFARAYALLAVFLLATVPQVADYAMIIHADLVLTAFVGCALAYFVLYVRNGRRPEIVLSSVLFSLALWIKNEAAVFVAAFLIVLAIFSVRTASRSGKRVYVDLLIAFILVTVIAAPWFWVKASNAASNSDIEFASLTPARVWQNIKDIPILLNMFQQEVFGPKKWNIFWVMFFAALVWKRKELKHGAAGCIALFILLSAAGYFTGYMATTGTNLYFYVNTTISRFMLHFSVPAVLLMAFLLREETRSIAGFATEDDNGRASDG